jgi:hypothetical protein
MTLFIVLDNEVDSELLLKLVVFLNLLDSLGYILSFAAL